MEARRIRGRAGYDLRDIEVYSRARCFGKARNTERVAAGKEQPPRKEIHQHARKENHRLLAARCIGEAPLSPLPFSFVPEEPHEAAKGYPVERIFRIADFSEPQCGRWISYAEFKHLHPAYFCDNEMPQFVNDDESKENQYYQ